ncbi:MAG: ferritin family protein [Candidatus Aminicenantales bacterium]
MDLSRYSLSDLLLTALRCEIEARDFYDDLAGSVKNYFLKDRLKFLSTEEEKHREAFKKLFHQHFPDQPLTIPENVQSRCQD